MKIGIVTFHWATNYGAVLQAYALQTYLENSGYQVEIINYVPFRNKFVTTISRLLKRNFSYFKTEKKINYFRKKYLHLSKKYSFISSLKDTKDKYNCAIAGSDQIWNVSFTLQKGKKPNLTYFLSFLDDNVKKISYAASFGTECVPDEYVEISKPCLEKFQCLSVREMSGVQILNKIGFDAELVCDPTLLINSQEYQKIMQNDFRKKEGLFSFVLHNDENSQKIVSSVLELTGLSHEMSNSLLSVSEWLCCIRDSSLVVSNSFHCIMFSLIFNKPFVAVGMKGSGMNDRLLTLLKTYNLENRIIVDFDKKHISDIVNSTIDWNSVNKMIKIKQEEGRLFLKESIK